MMRQLGSLNFEGRQFDLEETNLYGIWESFGYMSWDIELYPSVEDNYMMFNGLTFDHIYLPQQLSNLVYHGISDRDDLYEHTVYVNGRDRVLKSVDLTFGKWDGNLQIITVRGKGVIMEEKERKNMLPAVSLSFEAILKFTGLNMFETSLEEVHTFVERHMPGSREKVEIKFEKVASGLQVIVKGPF
jgi:hypothetical protein